MGLPDPVRPSAGAWRAAAVALAVIVGIVSMLPPRGTPGVEIADLGEGVATAGHAVAYALLGLAFGMSVSGKGRTRSRMIVIVIIIVIILASYGALLEVLQESLGSRSFQPSDVLANALGALLGVLIALGLRRPGPTE